MSSSKQRQSTGGRFLKKSALVLFSVALLGLLGFLVLRMKKSSPPVVLITIDSCGAVPLKLGHWQERSTTFTSAICSAPLTLPSHASIHTGLLPYHHGVRDDYGFTLPGSVDTLAERFKEAGYATAAFVSVYPLALASGLGQGFDIYDDALTPPLLRHLPTATDPGEWYPERSAEETVDRALEWLSRQNGTSFLWVHLNSPHKPYHPPEAHFIRHLDDPYAAEMEYAATQVNRLLERLPAASITVVLGSHGEAVYDEGPERTHGMFLREATIKVPLQIQASHLFEGGKTVDPQVQTVDLYPTLLSLSGISCPSAVDGKDLSATLKKGTPPPERPALLESMLSKLRYEGPELWAVRDDQFKLVWTPLSLALYRINTTQKDEEEKNVADQHPDQVERLFSYLPPASERSLPTRPLAGEEREFMLHISAEEEEQSVSLKRIEETASFRSLALEADQSILMGNIAEAMEILEAQREKTGPNLAFDIRLAYCYRHSQRVRDALPLLGAALLRKPDAFKCRIELIHCLKDLELPSPAIAVAKRTAELYPQDGEVHYLWGMLMKMLGKREESFEIYKRGAEMAPHTFAPLYNELALLFSSMGRSQEALTYFQKGLGVDPHDPKLLNNQGTFQAAQGNVVEAIDSFQTALRADPSLVDVRLNLADCLMALERSNEACRHYEIVAGTYTAPPEVRELARSKLLELAPEKQKKPG